MERNYGIDLLRLVAMFFVVILHVLGQGGVLANAENFQYNLSWLLETVAYCAVDCYAIISGYVCYREKENRYQYLKYITFWMPVFIYSFGITFCAFLLNPKSVGIVSLIKSALPVATGQYWYVCAYTALFFLIPWVNKMIRSLKRKELNRLVLILIGVFSGYSTFSGVFGDPFKLEGGYSFIWLLIMYIIGAWIKKNNIDTKFRSYLWILLMTISVIIAWIYKIFGPIANSIFISYISFTVVLEAVCLVVLFSRLKFNDKIILIIRKFSPAAFGVYLIHVQGIIWTRIISGSFSWIAKSTSWLLIPQVLGCALGIFLVCLIIESFRLMIFKALNINNFILNKAETIIKKVITLVY